MCLGSLILAIIQVVLFIIRSAREANRDGNNGALKVVLCVSSVVYYTGLGVLQDLL